MKEPISSSASSITDPHLPQSKSINENNDLPENKAPIETEVVCEELFSEIIKNEDEEVVTISDACSTNSTVFALNYERKRLRSSIDEEETESGNRENNNGQEDETEETGEGESHEENRENAGGEDSGNHQNSELNDQSGNQESGQDDDGKEEKREKEENKDNDKEEKDEDEEERKRKAAKKGKQQMTEKCLKDADELNKDGNDDRLDLAILESIWKYKCENRCFLDPHSVNLYFHVKDAIPNLKIPRLKLAKKIVSFQENFNRLGGNPDMDRPIDQEIFNWCKRIWGNSERKRRRSPSTS